MATTTINSHTGDGSLYTYNIFPSAANCATPSRTSCYTDTVAAIGSYNGYSYPDRAVLLTNETEFDMYWQCGSAGAYQECHTARAYLYFDTSGISGADVSSAKIRIYFTRCSYYYTYGVWVAGWQVCQDASGTYPTSSGTTPALEVGDFDKSHYSAIASMSKSTMNTEVGGALSPNQYVELSIPTSAINTEGLTKLVIRQYDPAEWASTIYNGRIKFQSGDGANPPQLVIDYTTPVSGACSMAASSSMAVTAGAIRSAVVNLQSISSMVAAPIGVQEAFATMVSTSSMTATATLTLGEFLRWLGTLDAGDTLVLNCGQRRVTLNGANALKDIRGQWVSLAPGDNAVTLADTEASRTIDVEITHSPRWA